MEEIRPGRTRKREQVRDRILELVESSPAGHPLPSERDLSKQLGVSRPTLRSAVDELVASGLVIREHGRGMFVARDKVTQELVSHETTADVPRASGAWSSRVLDLTTISAGPRIGRRLTLSPSALVVHVARLVLVDGEPMAIEYLYFPAHVVPGLAAADVESGDLYDLLRERYGVRVSRATQSMEATVTSEEEASIMGVAPFSAALVFERLTLDADARPVEYVHSIYRGDRYRIVSRLALDVPQRASSVAEERLPGTHYPGMPGSLAGARAAYRTSGDVQASQ
ncbi:GntR family transcriptional regulator [Myceligenerans pegani]|uniref:GntR family transcriptional regulator n=1 Tax=Myceligenerans pegani TaxID=2776917 RepID=UPI00299DD324|nr:GntR family transcriptional regulator [Myceligenerans sp. TRM 65318]